MWIVLTGGGCERIDENEVGATKRGSVRKIWGIEMDLWLESVGLLTNASFEVLSISSAHAREGENVRVRRNLDVAGICNDDLGT